MRKAHHVTVAIVLTLAAVGCSGDAAHGPTYNEGNSTGGSGGDRPSVEAGIATPGRPDAALDQAQEAGAIALADVSVADAASDRRDDSRGVADPAEASQPADAADAPAPRPLCADASVCGLTISAAAAAIPADGRATNLISLAVHPASAGESVELVISGRGSWESHGGKQITVALDTAGRGSASFLSDADGGLAMITARRSGYQDPANVANLTVDMPVLGDILIDPRYPMMGVKSSGFQESNLLVIKALTSTGVYPKGLRVEIKHKPLKDSTLDALPSCNTTDCEVVATAIIDERGEATATLRSGKVAGTAIVTVTATAGGQTKAVTRSSVIVGAKASGKAIAVNCTPRNVPALVDTDCTASRINSPVQCTASLSDRFDQVVGVPTHVTFLSEAGNPIMPETTLAYPHPKIGLATGTITTLGGKLPVDVAPVAGERAVQFANLCGSEHNPRDGIVTVIAMMKGEEGFLDVNEDGDYNAGEPFLDIAEPFVDADDNNTQNAGERYHDLNNNGAWDGPNGKWDADAMLWTQTRFTYSGAPERLTRGGVEELSRIVPNAREVPAGPGPGITFFDLRPQEVLDVGFFVSDINMNPLAPEVEYSVSSSTPAINVSRAGSMAPTRIEGFFYQQQYCDADQPLTCGSAFPPSATAKRCFIQARPTAFEYGVAGSIHIVGGSPGSFNLLTSSKVAGHTMLMEVPGVVRSPPP